MLKSRSRAGSLVIDMLLGFIVGLIVYIETGDFFLSLFSAVMGCLLAYTMLLPMLVYRFADFLDNLTDRVMRRWDVDGKD